MRYLPPAGIPMPFFYIISDMVPLCNFLFSLAQILLQEDVVGYCNGAVWRGYYGPRNLINSCLKEPQLTL